MISWKDCLSKEIITLLHVGCRTYVYLLSIVISPSRINSVTFVVWYTFVAFVCVSMQQTLNKLWIDDVTLDPVIVCHAVETVSIQHVEVYVCYCRNASYQDRTLQQLK